MMNNPMITGITMKEAAERFAIFGKAYGEWRMATYPEGGAFMMQGMVAEILTCKKRHLKGAFGRLFAFCLRKERQNV